MNIVKRPTIDYYQKAFPEAETALEDWYDQFKRTNFKTPQELKSVYGNASIVGNSRVVFNINGNKYRLVVKVRYEFSIAYIIWFGTHKQYDGIDVETVSFDHKLIEK
ncbi:MAG TPA: type II toxin-antitoxin system HigB family toxin [Mucilaginibacter sp.]|jgi:mRNA interferase HigB